MHVSEEQTFYCQVCQSPAVSTIHLCTCDIVEEEKMLRLARMRHSRRAVGAQHPGITTQRIMHNVNTYSSNSFSAGIRYFLRALFLCDTHFSVVVSSSIRIFKCRYHLFAYAKNMFWSNCMRQRRTTNNHRERERKRDVGGGG